MSKKPGRSQKSAAVQVWVSQEVIDVIHQMMEMIAEAYAPVNKSEFINSILRDGILGTTIGKFGGRKTFEGLDLERIGATWEEVAGEADS